MDSIVFKTVLPFIKPYPVLLNFPKSGLYLIISLCNIHLGFPEIVSSTVLLWSSPSCPKKAYSTPISWKIASSLYPKYTIGDDQCRLHCKAPRVCRL